MELLNKTEHEACFQYQKNKFPSIEIIRNLENEKFNIHGEINKIFLMLKGEAIISYGKYINEKVTENHFFFIPAGYPCSGTSEKKSEILIFRLDTNLNFCNHFSFEMLFEANKEKLRQATHFAILEVSPRMESYLETISDYLNDGIRCSSFLQLKLKELLYLLRAYYSKEALYNLFIPILSTDIRFSKQIHENSEKVRSVPELAKLMNYSISGFEKKFKRIFGVPAYQWMKTKKAQNIYHEINCSKKTFSEISYEYGFSSSAYFNDFCKANFGKPPGEIRKMKQKIHQL